ncbi:YhaN family protein [Citreimonas salinaria]|uniref:Uncharacterized protein YhaN n=1 Tax=Citreimonas salinaria TaxID=321339 RepID=A0A1H3N052_9RHOB|nr:YhaN family protein [Citreimonas salinaria]SDY82134.1 Uncharacterized protein YhaN [Citreimonas salinaria]
MRFRKLQVERFGHFTDREFDFGDGSQGDFHIIYGSNEAGKTTTMEAALRLLFGFPHSDAYAFRHALANLQVSAELDIDGKTVRFTRVKKRGSSLLDATGAALPDTALNAHLGGLTEKDFRDLLCLDDKTIEEGGEAIMQAKGDIGALLFSAASGLPDLTAALDQMRKERDDLWRKQAQKTRMAELKSELAEIDRDLRNADVTTSKWKTLKQEQQRALKAEQDAMAERSGLARRLGRLKAMQNAIPLLRRIDSLEAELDEVSDYPAALDFDPEKLVDMISEDNAQKREIERLGNLIDETGRTREGLSRNTPILPLSAALDECRTLKERVATEQHDIERRRAEREACEDRMRALVRDIGLHEDVTLESVVLAAHEINALDECLSSLKDARKEKASAQRELDGAIETEARARKAVRQAEDALPAQEAISAILERHDAYALGVEAAKADQAIAAAHDALEQGLMALGIKARTIQDLPVCPMSEAEARRVEQQGATLGKTVSILEAQIADLEKDLAQCQARVAALRKQDHSTDDTTARQLRADRDGHWSAHKIALTAETAELFESAMRRVDDALDATLSRARDLAQLSQAEIADAETAAALDVARGQRDTALSNLRALLDDVVALARAAGIPEPRTISDWLGWVTNHAVAAKAADAFHQVSRKQAPTLERSLALLEALRPRLTGGNLDLQAAIARAREIAENEAATRAAHTTAQAELATAEAETSRRRGMYEKCATGVAKANRAWREKVVARFGDTVDTAAMENSLGLLRELREEGQRRATAAQRVSAMENDEQALQARVEALCTEYAQEPTGSPLSTFDALGAAANAAHAAEDDYAKLSNIIAEAEAARDVAQGKRRGFEDDCRIMASAFPDHVAIETLADLRREALLASPIITKRREREQAVAELLRHLSVETIEEARSSLDGVDPADLAADIETAQSSEEACDAAVSNAIAARVDAGREVSNVTGSDTVAALMERRSAVELEMEAIVEQYMILDSGIRQADAAIRRYRDAHRSGMLDTTQKVFSALTKGAYPSLSTQPDGAIETLIAIDAYGASKRADEMSKGTRFQLYLALRAAAYEQLITQDVRLPFLCDDIFETFDEDRTEAACVVLDQIGQAGQAIYLTHHRHVVEIAQRVCKVEPTIHRI